jgi:uncharacterized protein YggE
MRLKLALLALPLALLAALFVYFQPRLGVQQVDGSTPGSPAVVAGQSGSAAPTDSTASRGSSVMNPYNPSAETTPTLLRAITVVGQGETKVAPDVAYVNAGVRIRETTAQAAQEKTNQAMAAVIAKIKSLGIDDKDIQTSGISLWPVILRENVIDGYEASNSVIVKVDIAKAGPTIDAAVEGGANSNVSIGFGLKDPSTATLQGLEAAAKDARTRADAIAKGLGVTIKQVQIAVEESSSSPVVMREAAAYAAADAKMMAPTPVQPGELTVITRVRVTYTY